MHSNVNGPALLVGAGYAAADGAWHARSVTGTLEGVEEGVMVAGSGGGALGRSGGGSMAVVGGACPAAWAGSVSRTVERIRS